MDIFDDVSMALDVECSSRKGGVNSKFRRQQQSLLFLDQSFIKMLLFSVFVALLGLACVSAFTEDLRYYNKINFYNFSSFTDFAHSMLELNDEGQLVTVTNLILGVATPECDYKLETPAFRAAQRYAGGYVLASASLPASEFPLPTEDCAVIHFYRIKSPLDSPVTSTTDINHRSVTVLLNNNIKTKFTFVNNFSFPIDYYWYGESKEPMMQNTIKAGASHVATTYLGHIFSAHEATDDEKPGRLLDFFVVNGENYVFSPINRLERCESYDEDFVLVPNYCESMEMRYHQFRLFVWHHKRLGSNYVQPRFVPPVTEEGFKLQRLPADTYRWLKAWYDEQRVIKMAKEKTSGVCMNQVVAPSEMTHLTSEYKDKLSSELKPILQEWFGNDKPDLILTSIYGIRRYVNGSILRMHVDTVNTHVVSAIINVDQKADKDWPLLILDHEGNEHNVSMVPGDMVLYESAKLLHGRPDVFYGEHYDNIFIHYKPDSGWDYSWI
jgi:hypothetical protein